MLSMHSFTKASALYIDIQTDILGLTFIFRGFCVCKISLRVKFFDYDFAAISFLFPLTNEKDNELLEKHKTLRYFCKKNYRL